MQPTRYTSGGATPQFYSLEFHPLWNTDGVCVWGSCVLGCMWGTVGSGEVPSQIIASLLRRLLSGVTGKATAAVAASPALRALPPALRAVRAACVGVVTGAKHHTNGADLEPTALCHCLDQHV